MAVKLQIRRGTATNWTSANPTLLLGEIGYESDTGNVKIGDGATAWTSLGYVKSTYPQVTVAGTDINASGYLAQGRYEISTAVTSNVPSGWTPASDGPGVLLVTKTSSNYVSQVLISTKTQKAFCRGHDGTSYTTWVRISQDAGSITATELASDAVTTVKIVDDAVTFDKIQNSAAAGVSVVGKSASGAGSFEEIAASANNHVFRRASGTLGFSLLTNVNLDSAAAIALSQLATQATGTFVGNNSGALAVPTALTAATARTMLGLGSMYNQTSTDYARVDGTNQVGAINFMTIGHAGGSVGTQTIASAFTTTGSPNWLLVPTTAGQTWTVIVFWSWTGQVSRVFTNITSTSSTIPTATGGTPTSGVGTAIAIRTA